ncbi:MAG: mechanosensitive ion channel [Burkholderiales bacterium]|nr:mechanosensitive ion channel [Burkholderiales bacterium]
MKQKAALDASPLGGLWNDIQQPALFTHVIAIVLCVGAAWLLAKWLGRRWGDPRVEHGLSKSLWARGGFPIVAAVLLQICDWLLLELVKGNLVSVAKTLFFALAVVRVIVYGLHRAFAQRNIPKGTDGLVSAAVWFFVALHLLGLLDDLESMLRTISIPLGKGELSLMSLFNGAVATVVTLLLTLWLGASLETRLMRMSSIDLSLRAVMSRVMRAALLVLAILISMSLAGIDLTILSVFSGALGVGLGLGMQRIASNYVSGFIILLDRSVRIGQPIAVDKYAGTVTEIKTRYTVLRSSDGTHSILPNEMLVSVPVINQTQTEKSHQEVLRVSVNIGSDARKALDLMRVAALEHPAVSKEEQPQAFVAEMQQGAYNLEMRYWILEGEKSSTTSSAAIRSDLLIKIAKSFQSTNVHFS